MEALRRLTGMSRPHLVPYNRQQTAQSSEPTVSPSVVRHPSVQDLVLHLASKEERGSRRSSDESQSRRTISLSTSHSPRLVNFHASSPALEVEVSDQMGPRSVAKLDESNMLGPFLQLPSLSKALGGDLARDLAEHFSPHVLDRSLDGVDSSQEPRPLSNTSMGYASSGIVSTESFNSAVQDLFQDNPNTAIVSDDGMLSKRSFNGAPLVKIGSNTYLGSRNSSPSTVLKTDVQQGKTIRTLTGVSDDFQACVPGDHPTLQENTRTPSPLLAATTHLTIRRNNLTSLSMDGPSGQRPAPIEFASQSYAPRECYSPSLPECCTVSPTSQVPENEYFPAQGVGVAKENMERRGFGAPGVGPIPNTDVGGLVAPAIPGGPSVPDVSGVVKGVGVPDLNAPNLDVPGVPKVDIPELPIPLDATGQLPPPPTPTAQTKKRYKIIRKGRNLILRKPVLSMVVGRQLAPPTAKALKLISQGIPFDIPDFGPLPTDALPVSVPGVPS